MRWILSLVLVLFGATTVVFRDNLEQVTNMLAGAHQTLATESSKWGYSPGFEAMLALVMVILGVSACYWGLLLPSYDAKLRAGRHPRDSANGAFMWAATGVLVWVVWLSLLYLGVIRLRIGDALAVTVNYCNLCSILGLLMPILPSKGLRPSATLLNGQ